MVEVLDTAQGQSGDESGHPLSPPPRLPLPQRPQPGTACPHVPIQGLALGSAGLPGLGSLFPLCRLPCARLTVLSASWSSSLFPAKLFKSLIWLNLSNRFVLLCKLMCLILARLIPDAQPAESPCPCGDGHRHIARLPLRLPLLLSRVILAVAAPRGVRSWANALSQPQGVSGSVWHGQDSAQRPQLSAGRSRLGTQRWGCCRAGWLRNGVQSHTMGFIPTWCVPREEADVPPLLGSCPTHPTPRQSWDELGCGAPSSLAQRPRGVPSAGLLLLGGEEQQKAACSPSSPSPQPFQNFLGGEKVFLQTLGPFFKGII